MSEIELEIGGVLLIGDFTLTVVDIDREDVTFKIDQSDSSDEMLVTFSQEVFSATHELAAAPVSSSQQR